MKFSILFLLCLLCLALRANSQSFYQGQSDQLIKVETKGEYRASAFSLTKVRLLDSEFKRHEELAGKWLRGMDNDRLLLSFRITAGIHTVLNERSKIYQGWESLQCELRGHTLGHVLSSLALMYASTGDAYYSQKGDSLVRGLAEVQGALKRGYISAFPERFVDRAIKGEKVWAPWYTLHKIEAGLLEQYIYCNNRQALDMAIKFAEWAYNKLKPLRKEQLAVMLKSEYGGIGEAFYILYELTGDIRFQQLAGMFYRSEILDPLASGIDNLKGNHANTYIPIVITEARGHEISGEKKKEILSRFFWDRVVEHHTFATGGNSDKEFFFSPDALSKNMGPRSIECCNVYNMLKLTTHLFTWNPDVRLADYYEQALYNQILAAQDPRTGANCYYMSLKPGLFKVYGTREKSFWCCMGTGLESNAKLAEAIYFRDNKGIYVNLFIPSELTWDDKSLVLRQEANYPESEKVRITIVQATGIFLDIRLRYPSWAVDGCSVEVNGKKQKVKVKPGNYISLSRQWKAGDVIEYSLPMRLRLSPANDDPHVAAVCYGPILLAGAMGTEGLKLPAPYAVNQWAYQNYNVPLSISDTIHVSGKSVEHWVKKLSGESLNFEITDLLTNNKTSLIPFYKLHHQRYILYWKLK